MQKVTNFSCRARCIIFAVHNFKSSVVRAKSPAFKMRPICFYLWIFQGSRAMFTESVKIDCSFPACHSECCKITTGHHFRSSFGNLRVFGCRVFYFTAEQVRNAAKQDIKAHQ